MSCKIKENELWLPLATNSKTWFLYITDEFMFHCWNFDLTSQHLYQLHIFSRLLYVIVLVHSIRWLWHNLVNLPNAFNPKGMEIMHSQVTETKRWMQNKDLLPPQYGAGRPPSFVLGCWKGHQETRVLLRKEGNAKVNAHQLRESEVRRTVVLFYEPHSEFSVILLCPITYTGHQLK